MFLKRGRIIRTWQAMSYSFLTLLQRSKSRKVGSTWPSFLKAAAFVKHMLETQKLQRLREPSWESISTLFDRV